MKKLLFFLSLVAMTQTHCMDKQLKKKFTKRAVEDGLASAVQDVLYIIWGHPENTSQAWKKLPERDQELIKAHIIGMIVSKAVNKAQAA